jgi:hypothetical protein
MESGVAITTDVDLEVKLEMFVLATLSKSGKIVPTMLY